MDTLAHVRGFLSEGIGGEFFPYSICVTHRDVQIAWDRKADADERRLKIRFIDRNREFTVGWKRGDLRKSIHHGCAPYEEWFTHDFRVYHSLRSLINGLRHEL